MHPELLDGQLGIHEVANEFTVCFRECIFGELCGEIKTVEEEESLCKWIAHVHHEEVSNCFQFVPLFILLGKILDEFLMKIRQLRDLIKDVINVISLHHCSLVSSEWVHVHLKIHSQQTVCKQL